MNAAETIDVAYQRIRPLLFRLDPETAHRLTFAFLSALPRLPSALDPPELSQNLFGLRFSNPVGLAAGLDKDLAAVQAWETLGFGFAELGTITPRPQPGNPSPRLWRLADRNALINSLGFPGLGMNSAARRLMRLRARGLSIRIGLNFGPNKSTPPEKVADDYASLMLTLGSLADFVVVNLSSPNTPGLRSFQMPEQMKAVIGALRRAGSLTSAQSAKTPPLLVKIAPDLTDAELDAICSAVLELKLDGVVATNTTISREGVENATPSGGLSGQPLKNRVRDVIRFLYRRVRKDVPIVGVGGIASAADAWEHIRAGASLVELYTGLIYEGPGLVVRIKSGLLETMKREGITSISDAVGLSAEGGAI